MKKSIITAILLFGGCAVYSQSLRILDPQNWRSGQGTIEETKITYEPQGLFMKVNWEITFSARGLDFFAAKDTVEVEYYFNLPKEAVVTDSWLWFGDSILKARIMDRWSASQIYENIVKRRRDPSVLYKNGNQNYELRIFPMAAKESRKVKITFLAPAHWNIKTVSTDFPAENLKVSKYETGKTEVFARLKTGWTNPAVTGDSGVVPLNPVNEDEKGNTHFISFDANQSSNLQKFSVNSPLQHGPFLSVFENGGEKYYQLALLPLENMNLRQSQKILFLFDYQKDNSQISPTELLNEFSQLITNLFTEKDSFNILYYDFELQQAGENWIPGDSASIAETINKLGENPFVSYSNLATLLASGIERAKTEENTKIFLIANTDKIDDIESANQLIEDLLKLADPQVPVFIADFQTNNFHSYGGGNNWYLGNEYFYRNLAKLTGGDYCNTRENNSFATCFNTIYQSVVSENGMIDIHTTLENGFCYSRFNPGQQNVFSNLPYLETGKFSGEFPFIAEVSGEYAGAIFSDKINIPEENAFQSDSLIAQFWMGTKILELEKSGGSYSVINDIIDKSISNRILSQYTAFLCLEPGMLKQIDNISDQTIVDRWDTETAVATNENEIEETKLTVYPNPFSNRTTIEVKLQQQINRGKIRLEIYDLFGQLIKTFDATQFDEISELKLEWDATNQNGIRVSEGTYLFVCTTPEGRISKKLVVM